MSQNRLNEVVGAFPPSMGPYPPIFANRSSEIVDGIERVMIPQRRGLPFTGAFIFDPAGWASLREKHPPAVVVPKDAGDSFSVTAHQELSGHGILVFVAEKSGDSVSVHQIVGVLNGTDPIICGDIDPSFQPAAP